MKQNCFLSTAMCFFNKILGVLTLRQRLENCPFSDARKKRAVSRRETGLTLKCTAKYCRSNIKMSKCGKMRKKVHRISRGYSCTYV